MEPRSGLLGQSTYQSIQADRNSGTLLHLAFDSVGPEDLGVTDGGKAPLIFLHGMICDRSAWVNVIRPIVAATGRKAYAFDARNHGDSDWTDEMSYEIVVEDLLHFMDGLSVRKAVLIGHSMGGRTAMFFTARKGERVEKLIVEDISPKQSEPHIKAHVLKYLERMQSAVEQIPPEVKSLEEAEKVVYGFLQPTRPQEDPGSRNDNNNVSSLPLCKGENGKFKWKSNMKVIADSVYRPHTEGGGAVCQCPTLIIYGTKSPHKVWRDKDFIRNIFPNARFRAVEGATHHVHLEYGEIFVEEVIEFINNS